VSSVANKVSRLTAGCISISISISISHRHTQFPLLYFLYCSYHSMALKDGVATKNGLLLHELLEKLGVAYSKVLPNHLFGETEGQNEEP
jgi:hypothetical protein